MKGENINNTRTDIQIAEPPSHHETCAVVKRKFISAKFHSAKLLHNFNS